VLDVAAGNGNATLAAARHFAEVTSIGYVGALLERGKERAAADRLPVTFQQADADVLPFENESFDVVLSTFGIMFTPNQEKAVSEMARVLRPGGRIGLANWTLDGFIGQLFKIIGAHVPGWRSRRLSRFTTSATALRAIGWKSSAPIIARPTAPSRRSTKPSRRLWRPTF
jgi:ubiquinone/menaquinone biosynthesis C-methylase UbiE